MKKKRHPGAESAPTRVKSFIAVFLAMLLVITALPLTAAAATLDGSSSFTTRDLEIRVDGSSTYLYWTANEARGTRYTPYVDLRDVAKEFGYQVEFMTAGQWYWSPVRQAYQWLDKDTYVVLESTNWDESRNNIRTNLKSRDLASRAVNIWDVYKDTWSSYTVYETKSLTNGGGFLVSIYDLPTLFPAKVFKVERVSNSDYKFNLTTTATPPANSNTATVRYRYNLEVSVDSGSWRTWYANEFKDSTSLFVDARDMARSLGYAIEFRKAGQYYTDPATGNSQWLAYDTYIVLSDTTWNNSRSSMRTDIRSLSTLTKRDVLIWQPYQGSWAWRTVNEVNDTKDGGGFMLNIYDLPNFFPGIKKVEQSSNKTSRFYVTTKDIPVITDPPPQITPAPPTQPSIPPPIIGGEPGYVDPNDIHGPKPPPVTDFIPANP